jgi:hypothetical protein
VRTLLANGLKNVNRAERRIGRIKIEKGYRDSIPQDMNKRRGLKKGNLPLEDRLKVAGI